MDAIITKYTRSKSGEIRASCEKGSVKVLWQPGEGTFENHCYAMRALCEKLKWNHLEGRWHPGEIRGGFAWVFVPSKI